MNTIDHHASVEALAEHLVHEDCPHILEEAKKSGIIDFDGVGGHCHECTLEHLKKLEIQIRGRLLEELRPPHQMVSGQQEEPPEWISDDEIKDGWITKGGSH